LAIQDYRTNWKGTFNPAFDGNGNVTALVESTTETIVAAYEYDAYGNIVRTSGAYATENPIRFSTKYHDNETGLVYYGFRYYSPSMGRFINTDPLKEAGGLNIYVMTSNNPVGKWDCLGLCPGMDDDGNYVGGGDGCDDDEVVQMDVFEVWASRNDPDEQSFDDFNDMGGYYGNSGLHNIDISSDIARMAEEARTDFNRQLAEQMTVSIADLQKQMKSISDQINASAGLIFGRGFMIAIQGITFDAKTGRLVTIAKLYASAGANGLLIQIIVRTYNVLDKNGRPVQSSDPKVNGRTSITYYEAWEVRNGKIGITVNGVFYEKNDDRFSFAPWDGKIASGSASLVGTMIFASGATITDEYQQETDPKTDWWSGNLPYTTPNAPDAWGANEAGAAIREIPMTYAPGTQTWDYDYQERRHAQ